MSKNNRRPLPPLTVDVRPFGLSTINSILSTYFRNAR
jgi:hypothetical protein